MSGVDPNASPVIVPGGGGASLPEATGAGQLLRSTGAGDDYAAVNQADVLGDMVDAVGPSNLLDGLGGVPTTRTLAGLDLSADRSVSDVRVALGTQTVDGLTSSTGWTLVPGNDTAAITGGVASFTTASGADTTSPNRVSATRTLGVQAAHGVDVAVRLASFTGTLGTVRALLNLSNKTDGANATYGSGDYGVSLGVNNTSGGIFGGEFVNSSSFTSRVATTTGLIVFDGNDWLRIILSPHGYSLWTGRGATFAAATWVRRAGYVVDGSPAVDSAIALTEPINVTLAGYRNGSQAQAHVVTFSDLRIVGW